MKLHPFSFLLAAVFAITAIPARGWAGETEALAVLASGANTEAKVKALNELALKGTAKSVPVLAKLLANKELHDYARNALELIPNASAGQALVSSLGKLQGKELIGVVITLGDRREKAAVPALQKMAADPKNPAADAALSSLALIATDEAGEAILAVLKSASGELKTAAAHAALRAAGGMPKESATRTALLEAVKGADVAGNIKQAAAKSPAPKNAGAPQAPRTAVAAVEEKRDDRGARGDRAEKKPRVHVREKAAASHSEPSRRLWTAQDSGVKSMPRVLSGR